jgi:hypothetical protein
MKYIIEEMKRYSGAQESESYIVEGITFFKNSSKLKYLYKSIAKKVNKHKESGKNLKDVEYLSDFMNSLNSIVLQFEAVEKKYKDTKEKEEKQKIKQEYAGLEKKFEKVLDAVKQDRTRKAMIALGVAGAIVAIILIGAIGLIVLENAGILAGAGTNIQARAEKLGLVGGAKTIATSTGNRELDTIANNAIKDVRDLYYDSVIKSTNDELFKTAAVVGATAASVATADTIGRLKKKGSKNRLFADAIEVVEKIKKEEKRKF